MCNRTTSTSGSDLLKCRQWSQWILVAAMAAGVAGLLWMILFLRREASVGSSSVPAAMGSPVRLLALDLIGQDEEILADPRFVMTSNRPPPFVRMPLPGMTKAKRLVLLTRNGKSVLVLPKEMAPEFRNKAFKDFTWSLEE